MPTDPNMGFVTPTAHGSADVWDTLLNDAMTIVGAHDHTTGNGVKIPAAALKINADVSWSFGGVYHALKDALAIDFQPTTAASVAGFSSALWVSSTDSELHFLDASARDVKITNAGALNISLLGGIGGDYASVAAAFNYVDASDAYTAKQQQGSGGVRQWARLDAGDLDLFEVLATDSGTTISNRVRQASPAGLAASYGMTWFAALPAGTSLTQVTAAGAWLASNTIVNAVTCSNLLTLSAGATASAGAHFTVSTTGAYKHGARELPISAAGMQLEAGGTASLGDGVWTFGAVSVIAADIPLHVNKRITNVTLGYNRGGAGTITMTLCRKTGTTKTVVSTETINTGTGVTTKAFTTPPNYTIATGEQLYVRIQCDNVAHALYNLAVAYDE